jgi:TPR repeat protein
VVNTRITAGDKGAFNRTLKLARLGAPTSQYEVGLMYANGVGVAQDLEQAIHWVRQAAEKGFSPAQYLLGTRYATGVAVEKDAHQALDWLRRAADQQHPRALYKLGKMYAGGQPQVALSLWRTAAEKGLVEAQHALGQAFAQGQWVAQDVAAARHWYELSADQGHAAAQCALADLIFAAAHAREEERAIELYRKAAGKFYAPAQVALELLGSRSAGRRGGSGNAKRKGNAPDRRRDPDQWEDAAASGDAACKYYFALMCERGLRVPEDMQKAEVWFESAARQGHGLAQVALARLLEARGDPAARDWLERAAQAGDAQAQAALGRLLRKRGDSLSILQSLAWTLRAGLVDEATAMDDLVTLLDVGADSLSLAVLMRAAELGSAQAQFGLAQRYAKGQGAPVQPDAAFDLYHRSALQGYAPAQCALGALYIGGKVVDRNVAQAHNWFLKAAEQDNAAGQWNAACLYMGGGEGLKKDLRKAFVWCEKAALQGFAPAQATMGLLYAGMKDQSKAAVWLEKAAQAGDVEAQYNLAVMNGKGQGIPINLDVAFHWLHAAAQQGLASAQYRLAQLYANGTGTAVDPLESHKWLLLAEKAGDPEARAHLDGSASRLSPVQLAEAKRRADQWRHP